MPRAASICLVPGCPSPAVAHGRCAAHAQARAQQSRRRSPDRRPNARQRGYTTAWDKLRARYIKAHPDCEGCGAAGPKGMIVDHIRPKRAGGQDEWSNCQTLCRTCHGLKTGIEQRGVGVGR